MTRSMRLFAAALFFIVSGCCHLIGDDEYDPCEDKDPGDECTICAPDDDECVETQEIKVCDADGECGGAVVEQHQHDHH